MVESVLVTYKDAKHPTRARKYLDLPGTIRDRGFSHVPIKTKQELGYMVGTWRTSWPA